MFKNVRKNVRQKMSEKNEEKKCPNKFQNYFFLKEMSEKKFFFFQMSGKMSEEILKKSVQNISEKMSDKDF